jgi:hypothetical protein
VRAFRLSHALHTGRPFNKSSGISNTHLSLKFDILLLLHWILLAFLMLILWVVGLIAKALLILLILLDLLSFAGLLENTFQLPNPPQKLNM